MAFYAGRIIREAGDGQPERGGADRPQRPRRPALRHLRAVSRTAAPAAGAGGKRADLRAKCAMRCPTPRSSASPNADRASGCQHARRVRGLHQRLRHPARGRRPGDRADLLREAARQVDARRAASGRRSTRASRKRPRERRSTARRSSNQVGAARSGRRGGRQGTAQGGHDRLRLRSARLAAGHSQQATPGGTGETVPRPVGLAADGAGAATCGSRASMHRACTRCTSTSRCAATG